LCVWLMRLGKCVALAIAVGVDHQRGPALRLLRVMGGVPDSHIEPAQGGAAAAGPQPVLSIALKMMGAIASVDRGEDLCLRIVDRKLAARALQREGFARRMVRIRLADRRL